MDKSRRQWKAYARETLSGNFLLPVLGFVILLAGSTMGGSLASILFPGDAPLMIILSKVFLFILALIMTVFSAGVSYMFLNLARGRKYTLNDMLYFFTNHPDRVIVAAFVMAVIDQIVSIPYNYYTFLVHPGETAEEQLIWMGQCMLTMLLASVLNTLLTLPFALTYYLLADNPEMGGIEALKTSMRLMKGNKGKYLLMQVSFLPLMFLTVFTLYIGMLWVLPYMEMTSVMFYRDICREFRPSMLQEADGTAGAGADGGFGGNIGDFSGEDKEPGDDYNSEA
ncbi:MAG: DUF975 family protein [Eubacteriales bacterium]|nr:DUF975 family protein [Eubacteriales bacterium]